MNTPSPTPFRVIDGESIPSVDSVDAKEKIDRIVEIIREIDRVRDLINRGFGSEVRHRDKPKSVRKDLKDLERMRMRWIEKLCLLNPHGPRSFLEIERRGEMSHEQAKGARDRGYRNVLVRLLERALKQVDKSEWSTAEQCELSEVLAYLKRKKSGWQRILNEHPLVEKFINSVFISDGSDTENSLSGADIRSAVRSR